MEVWILVLPDVRSRWRFLTAALTAAVASSCSMGAPIDVGTLDAVYAQPAEHVEILTLGRNQTLGELLQGAIPAAEQSNLLLAFRQHANPRRMRAGSEITIRYRADDNVLRGVDIAINSDETVRLSLSEMAGWTSEMVETPVYVDTVFAAGEIETALYNAVIGDPSLEGMPVGDRNRVIDHLDRVFQWQVDFSRQIRVGDTYRFVFEREVRPDGSMRTGKLLAAELRNGGTPYHAVYFDPNGDGEGSWYDLDGKSVRRAFLMKPLEYRRISGRFTPARYHPVLKRWRAHKGIDYAADAGTPVMATSDGVVVYRARKGDFGNTVEIRHPNGIVTRYGHLQGFKRGINVGSRVHQSDVIGYVGMTGLSTGPHLHYEMLRSGRQMDPLSVKLPAGDPVPTDAFDRWRTDMSARTALLESIPGAGPVRTADAFVQNEQLDPAQPDRNDRNDGQDSGG
jgi:murein DD-endopeptidase MepM/ murein hydrolase activator NlpD